MNLQNDLNVIHVLCEKNHCYNDAMRESLLGGIYEIADACIQTIHELESRHRRKPESEIELIKVAAEEGLQSRDFPSAFHKIESAALKAMAANPQTGEDL